MYKESPILNPGIAQLVAEAGHGDVIMIVDAGFPVPRGSRLVDISLTSGTPGFLETLRVIIDVMAIESGTIADEFESSADLHAATINAFGNVPVHRLSHERLKELAESARGFIRSGECTPYANVALTAGVSF